MYKIKSRIWIETEEGMFLGNGRIRLLKAIDETGSLNKAAKLIGMSYKKAWNLIDSVNNPAVEEVVSKSIGGKDGGGTHVTPYGKKLISQFEQLNQETITFINQSESFG
jgi:molybdate transport system regulatory protein